MTAAEGYVNGRRTGSRGVELEYRVRDRLGWASIGYAHYRANENRVESYAVPGRRDTFLAFAPHKLTARSGLHVTERWTVSPSLTLPDTSREWVVRIGYR